jgi:hypothetical protein
MLLEEEKGQRKRQFGEDEKIEFFGEQARVA